MTELYSILNNCDETIFRLNPALSKKGFELIKIDVPELEKNYKFLFNLPDKYHSTATIGFPNGKVTDTFFNIYKTTEFIDDWEREYIIVLKSNVGHIGLEEDDLFGFKRFTYIENFTKKLIDNLRLFKEGDIEVGCYFSFDTTTQEGGLYSLKRYLFTGNSTSLTDNDVTIFSNIYMDIEIENPLAERMKMYFDQTYSIKQTEIRYILLVTALESVLNSSKEQIAHTFARHLSLIISTQKEDFNINYKRIKKLYDFRSKMVHGSDYKKESLNDNCKELREYVRRVIVYINKLRTQDQTELFEILNEKGYE